ncbi:MAG: hypothetical protein RR940_03215 [Bacilli bacterium]
MRKNKILIFIMVLFVILCSCLAYGDMFFYGFKTYLYKDRAGKIEITTEKNDDSSNLGVNFKNEGSCDVFIRVSVFVYVYDEKNENNTRALNNSSIIINYNQQDEENWYKGKDDYMYYTKALKVGHRTERPLIKSIEINLTKEEKKLLEDKEIKADIIVEGVQVNNFAYKYEWDIEDFTIEDYFEKVMNEKNVAFESEEECKVIVE